MVEMLLYPHSTDAQIRIQTSFTFRPEGKPSMNPVAENELPDSRLVC